MVTSPPPPCPDAEPGGHGRACRALLRALDVEIVVPVHNEAGVLEACVRRLHEYVGRSCAISFRDVGGIARLRRASAAHRVAQSPHVGRPSS